MKLCPYPFCLLRSINASLHAEKRIIRTSCFQRCAFNSAATLKNQTSRSLEGGHASDLHSDALVFFEATGDLAYKKVFPSLQGMVKRGTPNVPACAEAA